MPRVAAGQPVTAKVRRKQPNGDIYIYERTTLYDPKKRYNITLSSTLLGKIPKGGVEMVDTRPKRTGDGTSKKRGKAEKNFMTTDSSVEVSTDAAADNPDKIAASESLSSNTLKKENRRLYSCRSHTGMMDIIDFIGKSSGIDEAVYTAAEDVGTAQKIISLARYLFATGGDTLPGILTWQLNHPLPYREGLSEETYHNLFLHIGYNESIPQNFFAERVKELTDPTCVALDTTTFSTYAKNQPDARQGYNKDGDSLDTIKLLVLYSLENKQPIAYSKQPGNIPDAISVSNALDQIDVLGLKTVELICDNGFYTEYNVAELLHRNIHFIMLIKNSLTWVRKIIDNNRDNFRDIEYACTSDPSIYGMTVPVVHTFHRNAYNDGNLVHEDISKKVYLHIFHDSVKESKEKIEFDQKIISLKKTLEENKVLDILSEEDLNTAKKYLSIQQDDNGLITAIQFNKEKCAEEKFYSGYFVLLADSEDKTFRALKKYRSREQIEDFFRDDKEYADAKRPRDWTRETLQGKLFIQFVCLCYRDYYIKLLSNMKEQLGKKNGDKTHDTKEFLKKEQELLSWLNNLSIYQQLTWFDAIDTVSVKTGFLARRWKTETIKRDRLFLSKLGMPNIY